MYKYGWEFVKVCKVKTPAPLVYLINHPELLVDQSEPTVKAPLRVKFPLYAMPFDISLKLAATSTPLATVFGLQAVAVPQLLTPLVPLGLTAFV